MNRKKSVWRRMTAFVLAAVMLAGLLPAAVPEAEAAEWMEPYLNQVVDWGIMRGNAAGDLNPDRRITRAEFVTMVNRAFGYTEVGPNPFNDVPDSAWYAEDICIAHQAGYFNGTSPTTASPSALVTREQAAVLIGRNLRLQGGSGLNSDFTDSREMGAWSRGLVQEAADLGIIQGYADGAFRPKASITRGQVACFLVRALGSLIHEPGEYNNMGVYGNLTINSPGVTLRGALITGNLYLTGGVGLGDLVLENVEVQGKIIIAGGGEAQAGENSILLRNVKADTMEVDSMADQFVTIRSEGLTDIGTTNVRTQAYLEDVTTDDLGLRKINFDAAGGARLDLAGNIKEFTNLTPDSTINLAQGIIQKVTMDEKATNATVNIDATTSVKEINLDVGSTIAGSGDIEHMNVDAAGTTSSILPDTIFVRPGINSNIKGQQMDSAAAAESSEDPRLLTGYPAVRNVASRSATAVFSTNKAGTLYWGLSALTDGSLGEEDLTTTSTTANPKVIRKGTVNVTAGKTEVTAALTGLTIDGSYYVSALLQDNRGQRSAVKVTAFVTPDDTTPAFVTGYPTAILAENDDGEQIIQSRVMANKTCRLYYALMPNNSTAPTAADFKANSLSGNLGYGVVDLRKNVPWLIPQVNSAHLREETDYDLYLWLTDVDGARSSAVRKIDVRTLDKTPPVILDLESVDATATSVSMRVTMNEPGTLYWAVVKEGTQFYRQDASETDPLPNTETAKMQIETGLGALRKGSVNIGQADTPVSFSVSGLAAQTGYDLYFVAKDRSGNYCVFPSDNPKDDLVPPMQIRTLDGLAPTVKQEFSPDGETLTPNADNSILLVFSERVLGVQDVNGKKVTSNFLELYDQVVTASSVGKGEKEAKDALANALAAHIKLWRVDSKGTVNPDPRTSANENTANLDWIVDFRKARVEMDSSGSGEMILTLPYNETLVDSGLNLASGATYYFTLTGIEDMSNNKMEGVRGVTTLPRFKTLSATVNLDIGNTMTIDGVGNDKVADLSFTLTPTGTSSVESGTLWDMLLWTDTAMEYELYSRTQTGEDTWGAWTLEGTVSIDPSGGQGGKSYVSLMNSEKLRNTNSAFESLNTLTQVTEFAVHVTRVGSSQDRTSWNVRIGMGATIVAGPFSAMRIISPKVAGDQTNLDAGKAAGAESIGIPDPFDMIIPIDDSKPPVFQPESYPQVEPGDTSAILRVTLDRDGSVFYAVAPVTSDANRTGTSTNYNCPVKPLISATASPALNQIPEVNPTAKAGEAYTGSPAYQDTHPGLALTYPYVTDLTSGIKNIPGVISGSSKEDFPNGLTGLMMQELLISGLQPNTTYILYIVTQGKSPIYSESVLAYQFTTVEAMLPKINVIRNGNTRGTIEVDRSSRVSYALVPSDSLTENGSGSSFVEDFSAANGTANGSWAAIKNSTTDTTYSDVDTVLDAMLTGYYIGDVYQGSVFDVFATDTAKNTYAALIDQTSQAGDADIAMTAREQLISVIPPAATNTLPLNMTGMKDTQRYTLLVVGHTVNGSKNAFRASRQYYNTAQTKLRVTDVTSGIATDEKQVSTAPTTGSGTLVIGFSDDLYYMYRDNTTDRRYPLDACKAGENGHTTANNVADEYKNLGSMMTVSAPGGGAITLNTDNLGTGSVHKKPVGNTLTFDVTKVRPNSFVRIGLNLCGASHNMRDGVTLTVYIRYNTATDEWYAEVTPAEWMN